jgi:tol-pal system protein YbgF
MTRENRIAPVMIALAFLIMTAPLLATGCSDASGGGGQSNEDFEIRSMIAADRQTMHAMDERLRRMESQIQDFTHNGSASAPAEGNAAPSGQESPPPAPLVPPGPPPAGAGPAPGALGAPPASNAATAGGEEVPPAAAAPAPVASALAGAAPTEAAPAPAGVPPEETGRRIIASARGPEPGGAAANAPGEESAEGGGTGGAAAASSGDETAAPAASSEEGGATAAPSGEEGGAAANAPAPAANNEEGGSEAEGEAPENSNPEAQPPPGAPAAAAGAAAGAEGGGRGGEEVAAVPPPAAPPENAPAAANAPARWPDDLSNEMQSSSNGKGGAGKLYRSGLEAMKSKDYSAAVERFGMVQKKFPHSDLTEPAAYFSASALNEEGKYDQAILQYNDLVMRYPKGKYAGESLLREAQAFVQINDKVDARLTLQKLINEHAGTPQAASASAMMKSLESD